MTMHTLSAEEAREIRDLIVQHHPGLFGDDAEVARVERLAALFEEPSVIVHDDGGSIESDSVTYVTYVVADVEIEDYESGAQLVPDDGVAEITAVHVDDEGLVLIPGQDPALVQVAESFEWPGWEYGW